MKLSTLISSVNGISDDSRKVKKGYLFVAISGIHHDGHDFIPQAIKNGAKIIVGEKDIKLKEAAYIRVGDSRKALALLASEWSGNPSRKLKIIGVTGTDGKTTTSTIIYWLLASYGFKVGLISSVSAKVGVKEVDTGFHVTNPEPIPLHSFLRKMVAAGCEYAVIEVTSHGLDQERVYGIDFEVGVLTNISREHLDYHKSFENYVAAKAKLFQNVKTAILNKIDPSYELIVKLIPKSVNILTYPFAQEAAIEKAIEERFLEAYNRLNAQAAVLVAKAYGIPSSSIVKAMSTFPQVPGRLEEVKNKKGLKIYIDFAHTPNALKNVLTYLRNQTKARLIAVFGCAGERDVAKRPLMAKIATHLADVSIFTAEDPRSEDVNDIIDQMASGAVSSSYHRIPERSEAIWFVINKVARKGDTVVITGKGHEESMAYDDQEYPWSDFEAVKRSFTHIHFMGIGGSAISGIAVIAKKMGYKVSGCDLSSETAYTGFLKKDDIEVLTGHNANHLKGVDILAVTPSVFFLNSNHPEVELGRQKKILMTWQELVGRYLQKGKKVICVSGAHGKSTTTAMVGYLLEKAGLDPTVAIGAKVAKWRGNFRVGRGKYFVTEADEFYDNFLNYKSDVIILNNIEFDHPDYFKSYGDVLASFKKFLRNLKGERVLIFNQDSKGVKDLFDILGPRLMKKIKLVGYSLTNFRASGKEIKLKVFGDHNVANALSVIALGKLFNIPVKTIKESLALFPGVGRRLELVGTKKGIVVYDDYAHHPTAIAATIGALRQKYPKSRIWAINEPHMYSRTKALLGKYKGVFDKADRVTIAPIYKSRDKSTFGISPESIVKSSGHKNIQEANSFDDIVRKVKKDSKRGDVILVMGAGDSYLLAQDICRVL